MYREMDLLDCSDEAKAQREHEYRGQYKGLILEAARIAVRGGLLSEAYEDFVIDYLDRIVDELSNKDFDYLATKGRIPAGGLKPETASELLSAAQTLRKDKTLTEIDRTNLDAYTASLEAQASKREENAKTSHLSEIEQLRQRIFKAADVLDAMPPDDPRMPEYTRLYESLWDKYRELENQGG